MILLTIFTLIAVAQDAFTEKTPTVNKTEIKAIELKKGDNKMEFRSKFVSRTYRQTIQATADKIFPLLCPVRESEWTNDWKYKLIYSVSGVAEKGCVFTTPFGENSEQVWIITKDDPINNEIQFTRFVYGLFASILEIHILPKDKNNSFVDVTYSYTGLSEEGNKYIDDFTAEEYANDMKIWEDEMNYFLKNGTLLKTSH